MPPRNENVGDIWAAAIKDLQTKLVTEIREDTAKFMTEIQAMNKRVDELLLKKTQKIGAYGKPPPIPPITVNPPPVSSPVQPSSNGNKFIYNKHEVPHRRPYISSQNHRQMPNGTKANDSIYNKRPPPRVHTTTTNNWQTRPLTKDHILLKAQQQAESSASAKEGGTIKQEGTYTMRGKGRYTDSESGASDATD